MAGVPSSIAEFLRGKRFAVAGVSRNRREFANAIFRKFQSAGYEVVPVNPNATTLEGVACYPDLASVPGQIDGVFAATSPKASLELIGQCAARGVPRIWFHRAFGAGSVPQEAVEECRRRGVQCIAGGCPMMFISPDVGHRCIRWWLGLRHRLPS